MTEEEWLECADPHAMLELLRNEASDRKLWLIACGCCRAIWHLMHDPRSRQGVEIAERIADGHACRTELERASEEAQAAWREHFDVPTAAATQVAFAKGADARSWLEWKVRSTVDTVAKGTTIPTTDLFRDIFGNPFRPVTIPPALLTWRDCTIPKLAQAAYDERELPSGHLDVKRLAILADALEEAGCTNEDVLAHLRGAGPHVRGCWVVDLLLGKE